MRVLLIEDDRTLADYVAKGLRESGHVVDVCRDGKAGICPSDRRADDPVRDRASGTMPGWSQIYKFKDSPPDGRDDGTFGVRTSYALNAHMHYNFQQDHFADAARQVYAVDGWWTWFGSLNAAWLMRPRVLATQVPITSFPNPWGTMVGWRHGKQFTAVTLYRDGHASPITPRVPRTVQELDKTVDTVKSFTWLPGESSTRTYDAPYQTVNPPAVDGIAEYSGRLPYWVTARNNGSGRQMGSDTQQYHPYAFPEELSAVYKTLNRAWRKLPSLQNARY